MNINTSSYTYIHIHSYTQLTHTGACIAWYGAPLKTGPGPIAPAAGDRAPGGTVYFPPGGGGKANGNAPAAPPFLCMCMCVCVYVCVCVCVCVCMCLCVFDVCMHVCVRRKANGNAPASPFV